MVQDAWRKENLQTALALATVSLLEIKVSATQMVSTSLKILQCYAEKVLVAPAL